MLDLDPLTFDFGLPVLEGDRPTPPKKEKDGKEPKRLARCGKCANCSSQDCGTCYNCADKPKFGGPGIKKQACISRKCLKQVPKDSDDGAKAGRKRPKPRPSAAKQSSPAAPVHLSKLPPKSDTHALQGLTLHLEGSRALTKSPGLMSRSTTSSPGPLESPGLLDDESTADIGDFSASFAGSFVGSSADPIDSFEGLHSMSLADEEVLTDQQLADQAWSDNLARPKATAGWRSLREAEVADPTTCPNQRDWSWNNFVQLQEDFYVTNERHRREASPSVASGHLPEVLAF